MANGRYIVFDALRKFLLDTDDRKLTEKFNLIIGDELDTKNFQVTDETFLKILQNKGLIPSFTPSDSGDTIENIQFDPATSELTITTDKQTFVIAIPQFYKVDTITERDALITSVGETALIGSQVYVKNTTGSSNEIDEPKTYRYDGLNNWTIIGEGSGGSVSFDGNRTVTRNGLPAINAGGTSITEWANNYFFPAEDPVASISGGKVLEYGSPETQSITWIATKKTYGIAKYTLTTPSGTSNPTVDSNMATDGALKNSTQTASPNVDLVPINAPSAGVQTIKTVTFEVEDNKSNTDINTTNFTFRHGFYWGVLDSDDDAGTNSYSVLSDVIANPPTDAGILSLEKELRTNFNKTLNVGGGGFTVFAFPTLFGTPSFVVNGLPNTAFTKVRNNVNFINSLGFLQPYDVWVLNDYQNSPSNIEIS